MFDVDWRVHDGEGVTLVATVVESTVPTPRRVRIDSRLDGPVLPPRRRGVPERGWDGTGYDGVVPGDGRLAVGFACRSPPAEPPVEVSDEGRADPASAPAGPVDDATTPAGVARSLRSPAPPRDAVPRRAVGVDADADVAPGDVGPGNEGPAPPESDPSASSDPDAVPGPVAEWLDAAAARVERAERLAAARELDAAAAAVEAAGGLDGVEALLEDLAADAAALRAVADRAGTLAADCEVAGDVPVEAYRRLA